jgi:hypothetical protein
VFNNEIDKKSVVINYEFVRQDASSFSFQITNKEGEEEIPIFLFATLDLEVFREGFKDQMKKLITNSDATANQDAISKKASEVFYTIKAKDIDDDEPITSYLLVTKDKIPSFLSSNNSSFYDGEMSNLILQHQLKNFEIEFEQGTIKNMKLRLQRLGSSDLRDYLTFENRYPVSNSSKFDPEKLSKQRLHCVNCGGIDDITRFVRLGDFLKVDNRYENYKEDYSPADNVYILDPLKNVKELKKEKRSQILEVAAFTDFVGFDDSKPNGIIQVEASRKINIWTKPFGLHPRRADISSFIDFGEIDETIPMVEKISKNRAVYRIRFRDRNNDSKTDTKTKSNDKGSPETSDASEKKRMFDRYVDRANGIEKYVPNKEKQKETKEDGEKSTPTAPPSKSNTQSEAEGLYIIKVKDYRHTYISFVPTIEPRFRFSKIEQNEKNFELQNENIVIDSVKINSLEFYRYQKISFGSDINLVKLNVTSLKLAILVNSGIYWYQTGLSRQLNGATTVNNVDAYNYNFNGSMKFFPDGRWGCSVGFEYMNNKILAPKTYFNNNSELLQYKFDGYLKTNDTNKLFFLFRLSHELKDRKNSFSQIQLGYSMNIFDLTTKSSNPK